MASFHGLLTQHFIQQKVSRLMSGDLCVVPPNASLHDIVDFLRHENCGAVIVNNDDDEIIGVLSERDVLVKPINWGESVASDIMTANPQVIRKTGSIARALHMVSLGGFRHLPVVHRHRYAEGMLSVKDMVGHIYGFLLKHHIGEQCDAIGEKQVVQQYFCSSLDIFDLHPPILEQETASVHDALQHLKKAKAGGLFLVDERKHLKGIFTDRDYIHSIAGKPFSRKEACISSYMTANPIVGYPADTVYEAYEKLSSGGFRHLPIVQDDVIVGMLSIKDFLDLLVRQIVDQLDAQNASPKPSKSS